MKFSLIKPLFFIVAFFTNYDLIAQGSSPAIAYPVQAIVVDGNLNDWPLSVTPQAISYVYDDPNASEDDFKAEFRVGYNLLDRSLYIGLEVIDEDHIVQAKNAEGLRDMAILYLDLEHQKNTGYPVLFSAAENFRDISRRPLELNPENEDLSWKTVEVKIVRKDKKTIYEWKVFLGKKLEINKPIGIDFFVIDADNGQEGESLALWTEGFGKSLNAIRLGEVIPVATDVKLGTIKGSVITNDSLIKGRVNRLHIESATIPHLWVSTMVDSLGHYKTRMPVGNYRITPAITISSNLYSEDFHQNSRRIDVQRPVEVNVRVNSVSELAPLRLKVQPLPRQLFEDEGALLSSGFSKAKINEFVKAYQEYFQIPGISLALIKDGKLVYNKATGVKNAKTNEPLNSKTVFEGASITKTVFAIMVLRYVERGIIDLDKPLFQYLPFPNIEKDERSKLLTARMVLNHQSGLENWPFRNFYGGPNGYLTGKEIQLNFEPGTAFHYSGEAMNYLGRVLSYVAQKSLTLIFKEEIAIPFGMTNSYFTHSTPLESNMSMGHYHRFPRYKQKVDIDSPASSIMTEAGDFSNFVLGLIHEEHLSKELYRSIQTPQSFLTPGQKLYDPDLPQGVANGFFVQETPQGKVIAHGGNNGDFECKYGFIPEKKAGYVVFANSNLGDEFIRELELYLFRGSK